MRFRFGCYARVTWTLQVYSFNCEGAVQLRVRSAWGKRAAQLSIAVWIVKWTSSRPHQVAFAFLGQFLLCDWTCNTRIGTQPRPSDPAQSFWPIHSHLTMSQSFWPIHSHLTMSQSLAYYSHSDLIMIIWSRSLELIHHRSRSTIRNWSRFWFPSMILWSQSEEWIQCWRGQAIPAVKFYQTRLFSDFRIFAFFCTFRFGILRMGVLLFCCFGVLEFELWSLPV
jgi:hypothetical protein